MTTSLELKELGNTAFKAAKHEEALQLFSKAIELDKNNEVLYCNRSMCHAALQNWAQSVADAKQAIALSEKYIKAHFRLVKAQLELKQFREARMNLLNAIRLCGENKEFRLLEDEVLLRTRTPLRPRPVDFEVLEELGEGNFTKVYKVMLKSTGDIYAMKVIDKMNAKKMERRHKNINNEILMEKRVLNKLSHPNIVTLIATFQDDLSLYYQMEFFAGGEMWSALRELDESSGLSTMVGFPWSLSRFYMGQLIDALEYMHKRGIVHRDLKPENMLLDQFGHLKLIDFGTAKDLLQPDLNGPEFVGTAEYMAPSVVAGKNTGCEGDLWSMGVILYQFITGQSAFHAASPYLVFLRIKRGLVRYPSHAHPAMKDMLRLLLEIDGSKRLANALGREDSSAAIERGVPICYDHLRNHPFFTLATSDKGLGIDGDMMLMSSSSRLLSASASSANVAPPVPAVGVTPSSPTFTAGTSSDSDSLSLVSETSPLGPAVRIPLLSELCVSACGRACMVVAEAVAQNGGVRPQDIPWMRQFNLLQLASLLDRRRIAHYLNRRHRLHYPGIHRLFFKSVVDARCNRVDMGSREYIGFTRDPQGQWDKDFFFVHLADPLIHLPLTVQTPPSSQPIVTAVDNVAETSAATAAATAAADTAAATLRAAISSVNKLRPRFLVMSGNFTYSYAPTTTTGTASVSGSTSIGHEAEVELFRKTMARVSETIPILFVPGERDMGIEPTPLSLAHYQSKFGSDYFGFWYGGLRCLVINSPLLICPDGAPAEAALQESWLEEEIEQAKLCSTQVILFSHHPWFLEDMNEVNEGDQDLAVVTDHGIPTTTASVLTPHAVRVVPSSVRAKWLPRFRHSKIRFLLTGGAYSSFNSSRSSSIGGNGSSSSGNGGGDGSNDDRLVAWTPPPKGKKCFPRQRLVPPSSTATSGASEQSEGEAAGGTLLENMDEMIDIDGGDDQGDTGDGPSGAVKANDCDEDDDDDDDDEDKNKEDEEEWLNQDLNYDGPTVLLAPPLGVASPCPAADTQGQGQLRIVKMYEHDALQEVHSIATPIAPVTL